MVGLEQALWIKKDGIYHRYMNLEESIMLAL